MSDVDWGDALMLLLLIAVVAVMAYAMFAPKPAPAPCTTVYHPSFVQGKSFDPSHLLYFMPVYIGKSYALIPIYSSDRWSVTLSDGTVQPVSHAMYNAIKVGMPYQWSECK